MNWWYRLMAKLFGRNSNKTPAAVITGQMQEPRPLPLNRPQWEEWCSRIISGALLEADVESLRFSLANMLLHLGPTESHKPDAYFIHSLRKYAVNQVAVTVANEIKQAQIARIEAEKVNAQVVSDTGVSETGPGVEAKAP